MLAFVGASPASLTAAAASSFVTGTARNDDRKPTSAVTGRRAPTMKVLDGLDTRTQAPYGFSRYILGPFQPLVLSPVSGDGEREVVIRAAYRHIFGNAYLMEEERAELSIAESQYKLGAITAREFVRALGKSSAYKTRFFEGASQYRFIELNFMHFLGRAPDSRAEVSEHLNRYVTQGIDADIDSYIDSDEYSSVFGEDNIPFLRFRGAYTPCDSFNKQCALKGGWANSDKAMGGAALSGYNGSDGKQFCTRISAYVNGDVTTPYEEVAENTPLKTTAPNWYACPDPALAPTPGFISTAEVAAIEGKVAALQSQYDAELERKSSMGKDQLAPFRNMASEMGPMIDRGFAYDAGDPLTVNPYAKVYGTESPLAEGGCKSSDYIRFHKQMEMDTLSRLEKDLEEAKAELRVLSKALEASTPVTPTLELPGQVAEVFGAAAKRERISTRPRIKITPLAAAAESEEEELPPLKVGPISLPRLKLPDMPKLPEMPSLPSPPSLPNPFKKKE